MKHTSPIPSPTFCLKMNQIRRDYLTRTLDHPQTNVMFYLSILILIKICLTSNKQDSFNYYTHIVEGNA